MSVKNYYECFNCRIYSEQINTVYLNDDGPLQQKYIYLCNECIKKHNQVEKKPTK